jgi:membrane protein YdbS with pleckstrin-like domain
MSSDLSAPLPVAFPGLGEDHQLDPRSIPLQRIGVAIVSVILAIGSGIAGLVGLPDDRISIPAIVVTATFWLVGNGLLAWHGQRWQAIEYRHTWYRVDEQGLEIRRGVLWRVVTNVPRSRVQHTDVSQGPLERRYGLGTLVVYTAGTDHAKVTLSGLDHAVALRIREHLMPERGTDAV